MKEIFVGARILVIFDSNLIDHVQWIVLAEDYVLAILKINQLEVNELLLISSLFVIQLILMK